MKCSTHADSDAAAQCRACSRGLCHACSSRFTLMMCEGCLLQHNRSIARSMYLKLAGTVVAFAFFAWMALSLEHAPLSGAEYAKYLASRLMIAAFFAFAIWGWDFLDRNVRHLVVATPLVWFFYLWIKLWLALLIGIFVGPYQIYRMVREIRTTRVTARGIAEGLI